MHRMQRQVALSSFAIDIYVGVKMGRFVITKKPTDGFEPSTPGLQNQSSTVELRWHIYISRVKTANTLHKKG